MQKRKPIIVTIKKVKKLSLFIILLQLILYSPVYSCDGYAVKKGDNLFRIALNNNTTVKELAIINGISDPTKIFVGQCILLRTPLKVELVEYENNHTPKLSTYLSSKYFSYRAEQAKNVFYITEEENTVTFPKSVYLENNIALYKAHYGLAGDGFHLLKVGDWLSDDNGDYEVTEILHIIKLSRTEYQDEQSGRYYRLSAIFFGNLPDKKYDIILITCLRRDLSGDVLVILGVKK